ncbi:MAG: META domain-containing protein [Ornithinibacter sp.]
MRRRPMTLAVVAVTVTSLAVVGVLTGTGGARENANGSIPVGSLGDINGSWVAGNDFGAPAPVVGTVSLTIADGFVLVETGCNTGRARASVVDSRLVLEELATTRKSCPPPLAEQETWVVEMVTNSPRLELSGPYLSLHWGTNEEFWITLDQVEDAPTT